MSQILNLRGRQVTQTQTNFSDSLQVLKTLKVSPELPEEPLNLSSKPDKRDRTTGSGVERRASDGRASAVQQERQPQCSSLISRPLPRDKNLIQELIENDHLEELIHLKGLRPESYGDPCQRLSKIGDEIVEKLVEWTKHLPFYNELPVDVHTQLLSKRWAELVLLSTCYYSCNYLPETGKRFEEPPVSSTTPPEVSEMHRSNRELARALNRSKDANTEQLSSTDSGQNLRLLCSRLEVVMQKSVPTQHVEREAGDLVRKFTLLLNSFSKLQLTLESYVCLKAITLLHSGKYHSICYWAAVAPVVMSAEHEIRMLESIIIMDFLINQKIHEETFRVKLTQSKPRPSKSAKS